MFSTVGGGRFSGEYFPRGTFSRAFSGGRYFQQGGAIFCVIGRGIFRWGGNACHWG